MNVEGGCYCGAVRYKAEGDALFKGQCHCRECQYISGGSPNMVMAMTEAGFAYTKGSAKAFRRGGSRQPRDPRVLPGLWHAPAEPGAGPAGGGDAQGGDAR